MFSLFETMIMNIMILASKRLANEAVATLDVIRISKLEGTKFWV